MDDETRERFHSVDKSLLGLEWRQKSTEHRVGLIEPKVASLAKAEEIADAVAARVSRRDHAIFTTSQRVGAGLVGGCVAAAAIVNILSTIGAL